MKVKANGELVTCGRSRQGSGRRRSYSVIRRMERGRAVYFVRKFESRKMVGEEIEFKSLSDAIDEGLRWV